VDNPLQVVRVPLEGDVEADGDVEPLALLVERVEVGVV
jgi:hypothetical protein